MKNITKPLMLLLLLATSVAIAFSQSYLDLKNGKLLPASEEKFQEANDLVAPWRSSGCSNINREFREPNCHLVTADEWRKSDIVTLYNQDGSLWYRFSVAAESPEHFMRKANARVEFLPFATYLSGPDPVILRMVGESPHWYEVEVNEETRATKFILKTDPMWARTKWEYWLAEMKFFKFNGNRQQLRDKPNGKVIEESSDLEFYNVRYLKIDGDWAYVEGYKNSNTYQGWIKWRSGRKMLVKSSNGLFNVSKTQRNISDK